MNNGSFGSMMVSYGTGTTTTLPPDWVTPPQLPQQTVLDLVQLMKVNPLLDLVQLMKVNPPDLCTLLRERGAKAFEEGDDELAQALRTAWRLLTAHEQR